VRIPGEGERHSEVIANTVPSDREHDSGLNANSDSINSTSSSNRSAGPPNAAVFPSLLFLLTAQEDRTCSDSRRHSELRTQATRFIAGRRSPEAAARLLLAAFLGEPTDWAQ
jgi:hypothetical protein